MGSAYGQAGRCGCQRAERRVSWGSVVGYGQSGTGWYVLVDWSAKESTNVVVDSSVETRNKAGDHGIEDTEVS